MSLNGSFASRQRGYPALGAQFVDLRPISAVVEHADQQLEPMALDRLEFLDVHQQAAVALEQHYLAVRSRRRSPANMKHGALPAGFRRADRRPDDHAGVLAVHDLRVTSDQARRGCLR
jgi:hypothetical protein